MELTGDIQHESEHTFRSGRLRLTIPNAETKLRPLSNDPERTELLLRLQIPAGKSSLELIYGPIQK